MLLLFYKPTILLCLLSKSMVSVCLLHDVFSLLARGYITIKQSSKWSTSNKYVQTSKHTDCVMCMYFVFCFFSFSNSFVSLSSFFLCSVFHVFILHCCVFCTSFFYRRAKKKNRHVSHIHAWTNIWFKKKQTLKMNRNETNRNQILLLFSQLLAT